MTDTPNVQAAKDRCVQRFADGAYLNADLPAVRERLAEQAATIEGLEQQIEQQAETIQHYKSRPTRKAAMLDRIAALEREREKDGERIAQGIKWREERDALEQANERLDRESKAASAAAAAFEQERDDLIMLAVERKAACDTMATAAADRVDGLESQRDAALDLLREAESVLEIDGHTFLAESIRDLLSKYDTTQDTHVMWIQLHACDENGQQWVVAQIAASGGVDLRAWSRPYIEALTARGCTHSLHRQDSPSFDVSALENPDVPTLLPHGLRGPEGPPAPPDLV